MIWQWMAIWLQQAEKTQKCAFGWLLTYFRTKRHPAGHTTSSEKHKWKLLALNSQRWRLKDSSRQVSISAAAFTTSLPNLLSSKYKWPAQFSWWLLIYPRLMFTWLVTTWTFTKCQLESQIKRKPWLTRSASQPWRLALTGKDSWVAITKA